MSDPRIGSMCTGYAGLERAVQAVFGGTVAWHAENDPHASKVLERHFPWIPNLGDITKVNWQGAVGVDIVAAGFPCRNISNAGTRDGINGRWSRIWKNVAEAVRVLRPRLVVLENVAAIRSRGLDVVVGDLAAIGYDARWTCLRAGDPEVGAPHQRDRWLCIAYPANAHPDDLGRLWRPRNLTEAHGWDEPAHARDEAAGAPVSLRLLPTPTTSNSHGNRWNNRGDLLLPGVAESLDQDWVTADGTNYGPAVRRWEPIIGRPAPCPTEPGTKGNRRLSPLFVEWMMGLPFGLVTGVDVGRPKQIQILGNGVVPQQAAHALQILIPHMRKDAVA